MAELGQRDGLEGGLDEAAGEEVDGLDAVLAVADVAALDGDHADDGAEDGSLEVCVGRQADGHDGAAGPHVAGGLLEGQLRHGQQQHRVRAEPVGRRGLHVVHEVLALGEVDVRLRDVSRL